MREETGYDSDDVVALGVIHPNPAIEANRCHTFLRAAPSYAAPLVRRHRRNRGRTGSLDEIPRLIRAQSVTRSSWLPSTTCC
jgi:hypothetical protein